MAEHLEVTNAALDRSLKRLTLARAIARKQDHVSFGRRRASYLYHITSEGEAALAKVAEEGIAQQKPKTWIIWG